LVRPVFFLLGFVSQHRGFQGFKVADRQGSLPMTGLCISALVFVRWFVGRATLSAKP
jgi:hypothetical protein